MNNSPDDKVPAEGNTDDAPIDDVAAREAFIASMRTALKQFEDAIFAKGYREGREAGRKELDEQLNTLGDSLKQVADNLQQTLAKAMAKRAAAQAAVQRAPQEAASGEPTAMDHVLFYVTMNPGQRGVDIADALGSIPQPIGERTVRTALFRLRHSKKLMRVGDRWYTAGEGAVAEVLARARHKLKTEIPGSSGT
jgi:hypothetical protein